MAAGSVSRAGSEGQKVTHESGAVYDHAGSQMSFALGTRFGLAPPGAGRSAPQT